MDPVGWFMTIWSSCCLIWSAHLDVLLHVNLSTWANECLLSSLNPDNEDKQLQNNLSSLPCVILARIQRFSGRHLKKCCYGSGFLHWFYTKCYIFISQKPLRDHRIHNRIWTKIGEQEKGSIIFSPQIFLCILQTAGARMKCSICV